MIIDSTERENIFDSKHYVYPKKAYKKLKLAQNNNQSVYISGMTGYGKSSLILSILKKSDIYCISETVEPNDLIIPVQKNKPVTVVIDNVQFLPDSLYFEEIVSKIKELASIKDVWLIVIGRCQMPKWLLPIHIEEVFAEIDEDNFILSLNEVGEILQKWGLNYDSDKVLEIANLAQYVPISLRIIAINLANGKKLDNRTINDMQNEVWECIWNNVYEHWDMDILEVAMKLSLVEEFDLELAKIVTGRRDIVDYIDRMLYIGNFMSTRREFDKNGIEYDIYSVRENAKISLKYNMKKFLSKEEISKTYYNAGLYYECNSDPIKALQFYEEAGDLEQLASVLIKNSRKNPSSGYYYELREYYQKLPKTLILENSDLMSGMSMLQAMLLNIDESEYWYNKLSKYANSVKDIQQSRRAKQLLLVLDIALPQRDSAQTLISLKKAGALVATRKIVLPNLSVTGNFPSQMNGGKDFCDWSKKDKELADTVGKVVSLALGKYGKALVNLALAESYFEKGGESFDISSLLVTGRMQAESINNIEQIFVADGVMAKLYLVEDKLPLAIEIIENYLELCKRENKIKIIPNINAFLVRLKLYTGEISFANQWLKENNDDSFVTTYSFIYLTKVRVYIINGKYEEAQNLLQKLLYYSELIGRTMIRIESLLLMSYVRLKKKEDDYDDFFCQCLDIASEYEFVRVISKEAGVSKQLLTKTKWKIDTTQKEKYFHKVKSETEKISKYYPAYMKENSKVSNFSENALAILRLQAEGYSISDISQQLNLTVENVKYHSTQTYKKLGVNSKTGAVIEAKRKGIL